MQRFYPKSRKMEKDISSIHDDYKFQEIEWPVKKVLWICMGIFLLIGLLGGFGDSGSLLSRKTIKLPGATLQYERYLRVEKDFTMKITLEDSVSNFTLGLNKDFIDKIMISQITPQPEKTVTTDGHILFTFNASHGGTVTFFLNPYTMGDVNLEVGINGNKKRLQQFIYF